MNPITIKKQNITAGAGLTVNGQPIDLSKIANEQRFSVQVVATGNGTATVNFMCSNDGINYPLTGSPQVIAGLTSSGGDASDGVSDVITISPPLCKWLKLQVVETGSANSVTITAYISIQ